MHRTNIYNYVLDSLDNILRNGLDYYKDKDQELYSKLNDILTYINDNSRLKIDNEFSKNKVDTIKNDIPDSVKRILDNMVVSLTNKKDRKFSKNLLTASQSCAIITPSSEGKHLQTRKEIKTMMNAAEMKSTARNNTVALLMDTLTANNAIQFADASYAILQTVDGQEIWTEVTVKSKAYKATKISPAFNPTDAAQAWQEAKRLAAEEKARKAAEKGE